MELGPGGDAPAAEGAVSAAATSGPAGRLGAESGNGVDNLEWGMRLFPNRS
jgi:hypothetical protein